MKIIATALLSSLLAGVAGAEETIRPGYWESIDTVLSPFRASTTDHRCVKPADITEFMGCRISRHYVCTCPERSYSNGKIAFHGDCVDKKGQHVQISGRGSYTPTTLNLTADVTFVFMGAPLYGQAKSEAHRVGDACPADAR